MRFYEYLSLGLIALWITGFFGLEGGTQKLYLLVFLGTALLTSCGLWWVSRRFIQGQRPLERQNQGPANARAITPPNAILVDGSNVMHWGGDPSVLVLSRVLQSLRTKGYVPIVYFDANAGYKLLGRHMSVHEISSLIELHPDFVVLAPSRTTADEILLPQAARDGLKIVTNDRFLDWKQKFPIVGERGRLIKGAFNNGAVQWRYPLMPSE